LDADERRFSRSKNKNVKDIFATENTEGFGFKKQEERQRLGSLFGVTGLIFVYWNFLSSVTSVFSVAKDFFLRLSA